MDFIQLFSSCIPVKGASRSMICDLQRKKYKLIPNALYDIIEHFRILSIEKLILFYGLEHSETLKEYFDFLIRNNFAFYCTKDDFNLFPPIDLSDINLPNLISNAILEISIIDVDNIKKIMLELNSVFCSAIEIRFQNKISYDDLSIAIKTFEDNNNFIQEINRIIIYNDYSIQELSSLFEINKRLTVIIVADAPENRYINNSFLGNSQIIYTTKKAYLPTCCGNFSPDLFVTNISFFAESQKHNTCLNKKVAIDVNGQIKNCPSMARNYGSIYTKKLTDIIKDSTFTSLWNINKDQIETCKDCEFRHICMDCRAYLESPNDIHSKPLKCGYNPYTNEWEEEAVALQKMNVKSYYGL
jgi:SPASM domain peptide maturase of grasp-with-spasm system